ncbi:hypothetical protein [Paraferrimonas sedimenticola]|uniref:Uncharacterized protein n=1 Tax=Paraferrimonas sedimenticola TaxID=375674 RepID=A0AA37RZR2_9GAMM|nr:hypothetical protein [Paraferrimonas sedimenticola]GLP97949.1 hypothetical protein GCM10007895_32560 [Paraferrimonas sedimenticola]
MSLPLTLQQMSRTMVLLVPLALLVLTQHVFLERSHQYLLLGSAPTTGEGETQTLQLEQLIQFVIELIKLLFDKNLI